MKARRQLELIADHLCTLVTELTKHRGGTGPHWLVVATLHDALARHGVGVTGDDRQAAIVICVERHLIKAEGTPVHSVTVWQRDWDIRR